MNAFYKQSLSGRPEGEVQIGLWLSSTTAYMAEDLAHFRL